ncbi:MAG: hypothetical protein R3263_03565 [Myxococcota bacterium]|nr:hypothetical protein [Myxococcota bacterium]
MPGPSPATLLRPLCHEIGNLLAAIRLSGHLLRDGGTRDERVRTAREVEQLAAQAGALLAQIRPLFEGVAESRIRVTTESLLAAASRAVEEGVPEGVRLRIGTGRDLPDVRVDSEALHNLLVTLLLGALEAVPSGGRVRLEAGTATEGRRVVLTLQDDAAPLELDGRRAEMGRGRELTVRLAAAVIKASGGRVRVASGARRGNRIELWLPVAGRAAGASSRSSRSRGSAARRRSGRA